MTYTIDSLAEKLGLQPPEQYWLWSKENNPKHPYRSGKTTALLLAACVAAQITTDKIVVLGSSKTLSRYFQGRVLQWCKQVDISTGNIWFDWYELGTAFPNKSNYKVFVDHSRYEIETKINLGHKTVTLQELLRQQYLRVK